MDNWLHLLQAAVAEDRSACANWSLKLGYLTGEENEVCLAFPSVTALTSVSCYATDHVKCSRRLHDSTCNTLQTIYTTTICFWTGFPMGGYHRPDSRTHSSHTSA